MTSYEFLQWEQTTRDTIDLKKVYIDAAGDLVTGVLLSQIIYWNLPNQEGKTKLRIISNGELWLAKGREQWWDECRITPKQFDRSIKKLEKSGIVTTKIKKFDGNPTKHIKLNLNVLISSINNILKGNSFLPKGKEPTSLKVKNDIDQTVKSLTENTTKIKEQRIKKDNLQLFSKAAWQPNIKSYIDSYIDIRKIYRDKQHKRISDSNIAYVETVISALIENDISLETFQQKTIEYFQQLPPSNDGDILAFLKASPQRYFELDYGEVNQ